MAASDYLKWIGGWEVEDHFICIGVPDESEDLDFWLVEAIFGGDGVHDFLGVGDEFAQVEASFLEDVFCFSVLAECFFRRLAFEEGVVDIE